MLQSPVKLATIRLQLAAHFLRHLGSSPWRVVAGKQQRSFTPATLEAMGKWAAAAQALLRSHARKAGGAVFASKTAIATALGVSRTTLTDRKRGWLAQWERTGEVRLTRTSGGIAVSVEQKVAA